MGEEQRFGPALARVSAGEAELLAGTVRGDPKLRERIARYFQDLGLMVPADLDHYHYSAVFVSWCVQAAGVAPDAFAPVLAHAQYVMRAMAAEKGSFPFWAARIEEHAPSPGDIINFNRGGGRITFEQAKSGHYHSESGIVIAAERKRGTVTIVVGNDDAGSVSRHNLPTDSQGRLLQRNTNPLVCIVVVDQPT